MAHDLLTAKEVSDIFRVSRTTPYRWAREGHLTAVQVGATIRFRREDIERLTQPTDPEGGAA